MSGFPRWRSGNEFTCRCKRLKRCKRCGFNSCVVKIPWDGNGNPLQYSCLKIPCTEEPGWLYSSWDCEESDTTEHTHVTLRYVTLRYVTLRYICISLLRLSKRTLNLDSVNPFFLPTAWVTDVAAVKLWSCRWIQWLDRQRTTVCKGAASLNDLMEQNSHSSQQWRDYNMSSKLRQLLPKWALSLSEFFLPAFLPSEWCSKHNSEHAW